MDNRLKKLFKTKSGVRLDIGAGENKQSNWITMDKRKECKPDIVWDLQEFPYPIPDNSCLQILSSHVVEHIEPKYRIQMMNELWRICKDKGQLWVSTPYYLSFGAHQDPTHYTCWTEATPMYFDQCHELFKIYKPKPWKVLRNDYQATGNLECIFEAVKS